MTLTYSEESGFSGNGFVRGGQKRPNGYRDSTAQFITYAVSEADRAEPHNIENMEKALRRCQRFEYDTYYCVIAASEEGTSAISNVFDVKDMQESSVYGRG